jgi:hypothetical protein
MTANNVLFGITWRDALDATALAVNFEADTFNMTLCTSTYTPDADAHDFFADITNEVSGTGYSTPGPALDTVVINLTITTDYLTVDFADETIASSSITARQGVLFDNTLASDPLISAHDFGADYTSSAGNFIIQPAATGVVRFPLDP